MRQPPTAQPEPLRVPHRSVRNRRRPPSNMDRMNIPIEIREAMDRVALDIFTDMANAGYTFQECLAAIYASGISHAMEVLKEINEQS